MTPSRLVRVVSLFLLFAFASIASAATTEFRVFLDNDPNAGCTVAGMDGIDRVLVTQINDSSSPAQVTRVFRQDCMGVALGGPSDLTGSPWNASFNTTNRSLAFETRIPFMAFGANDMPANVIAGFQLTRLSASHTVLLAADGSLMIVPQPPSRRRAIDFDGTRHITLDGNLTDWNHITPITFGAAGNGGSQALRLLRVMAFADATDKNLYFAGVAYLDSQYPVADDDLFLRDPDQGLSVGAPGVLENDSDPQHQTLHAQKVSDPQRGSVILNDDGSFTYSPNHPQVFASDEFEYKVTAGGRESNTARVRISVDTGESPKTPNDDTYTTPENTQLNVPAPGVLDNDPDKLVKTTVFSQPSHGTLNLHEDGGFTYMPNTDFVGTDSFVYTATKKNGNNASGVSSNAFGGNATVTITVTEVISAPDAVDDNYNVAEDGILNVPQATGALANDTDPNGDSLTGTPVPASGPAHGTLTWNPSLNGAFIYQPDADYFGPDQFSYTVSDGAETDTAVVHINVTAVNDPPSFTGGGDVSTNEDTPFSAAWATAISKGPANESGQILTFTVTPGNPALFSVQPSINTSTGVLSFTPAPNANGTTSVTATLTDNGGGSNSSAPVIFNITINAVNDAPSFVKGGDENVGEDSGLHTVNPWATAISPGPADESGQIVTFNITGNTNPGLFSVAPQVDAAGVLTYTPAANATGTAQITLTLSDNGVPVATSAPQTFNITVTGTNDAPVNTVPAAQATNEDTALTFSTGGGNVISIADIDAGGASLQVTLAVTNGTLTADTGAAITNNNTANVTLNGTIANINASLDGLIFNPTPNFNGLAQLTITTNDQGNTGAGGALQDVDTVDINVLAVNDQPAVNAATFSLPENSANSTAVGTVTFTDPDIGQTHTFAITAGNTGGAFAIDPGTGAITVANSAALNFETTPTFSLTVTVQDNSGAGNDTGSATITINLTDVNEAPVANDATFAVDENSPNGTAVGTVVATDQDAGQTLTYAITAGNTGGAFAINASNGAITVANPINFETLAAYVLTVTVTDNGAGTLSDTATINININNVNEAPVVNAATFSLAENSPNATAVGTVTFTEPDTTGQTHTFAITAGNTGGAFAIDPGTGAITVANSAALNFETTPTFSLTVQVTDAGAPAPPLNGSATITINLSDVNENPVVNDQSFSVNENVPNGTVVGTVVATDPDAGQTLSYAITAGNTGGAFAINASSGQITVANPINFETLASYALTVTVTDNGAGNLTDTATITINVNDVNEAPSITPGGPFAINENSPNATLVGTVTASDPDTGQTLTYSIIGGNTGGAFAINGSGQITVANSAALDFETTPSFSLTVQVQDNGAGTLSDTDVFVVNINNVNEAPVVNAATFSLPENSPNATVVGTATFTEPDTGSGQTGTFSITGGNTGGAFAIDPSTGVITVANSAAVDFETNPTFALTVSVLDNGVPPLSGNNTVTVNLTDANEPPVVNDQSFAVDENVPIGTVVGSIAFSDPDGPTDTFAITSGNAGGEFAVNPSTGQITTAAALNFENTTSYNFTITISDAGTPLGQDTAVITININNLNEAPVVNPATFSLPENSANATVVGTVTFTEPDTTGQTHTFSITGGNTGGAFTIGAASGQITVANSAAVNFETNPTFSLTVQVTDAGAPAPPLNGTATITVNLTNVNDAPVYNDASRSIAENSPNGTNVGAPVTATDEDAGQTLTYAITAGNTGGAFAINSSSGQITVANPINFETLNSYSLTVTATDNGPGTLSDTATVTITVIDVNEPPVANDATFGINENVPNGTVVGTVVATDPDTGQTLTYAITAGNTGGAFAINSSNGQITVANPINFESVSSYSLTVTVTDNGPGTLSDPATITINVTNLNEAPVVNPAGPFSLPENSPNATTVGTPITFTEPDTTGQTHTYAIIGGNTGGAFAIDSSGQISVATSAAVNFEVNPTFTLTVQVTDAGAPGPPLSGSTSVTINLTNVNDAPVYNDASRSIAENSPNGTNVGAPVTASDEDTGQTLTYSITGGNTGGAFAINSSSGQITVANPINFETTSSYSLTVQATDNGVPVLNDTATVTITVTDVNEAPTANDATFAVNENSPNGTVVGTVVATDPDTTAPNNTLNYAITAGNTGGAFAINSSNGQITVANLINFEALSSYSLTVTVTDGGAGPLSDTATITINVTDLNEAPTATTDVYTALANTTLHIAGTIVVPATTVAKTGDVDNTAGHPRTTGLKANDTDPDTNPAFNTLTITQVTGNAGPVAVPGTTTTTHGTITLNADGSFLYTPTAAYLGADSFTYTLNDALNNVTGTVNLTVVGPVVWYVKNNVVPVGTGTSADPFRTLAAAVTASAAGDTIYVMTGDGTATNLGGSNLMKANQRLWGQGIALDITATNGVVLNGLIAAGTKPLIGPGGAQETVRVMNVSGVEAKGLKVDGGTTNAFDVSSTGGNGSGITIDNVDITAATLEGIDVNASGNGTNSFIASNMTIASTGAGIDVASVGTGTHTVSVQSVAITSGGTGFALTRTAGTVGIVFSNNTITAGGAGVSIAGGAIASTTITAFANNIINGNTVGTGISISNTTFDQTAGGAFQLVNAGTTTVGASGNGVGASGVTLTTCAGNLSFSGLSIYNDNGSGFFASSAAVYTGSVGLQIVANAGTEIIESTNGPAVDFNTVTTNLTPLRIKSTTTATRGVNLDTVVGTFTVGNTSTITNSAGGSTGFRVNNSSVNTTYPGTITTTGSGAGVALTTNSGTYAFTGALSLSTSTAAAFTATSSGTVSSSNTTSTITTTTGSALTVTNTNIALAGLKFVSITAGTAASGPAFGINLQNTGTTAAFGGLAISGGASAGNGGTIQKCGTGINLSSTRDVVLNDINMSNFTDWAIRGASVVNFTGDNLQITGVNGDNDATDDGSIRFTELTGSATISNSTVSGGWEDNIDVVNSTGSLNRITISNTAIGANSLNFGDNGILLESSGTGTFNATVTGCVFTSTRGDHIQYAGTGGNFSGDFVLTSNNFSNSHGNTVSGAGGIRLVTGGTGMTATITYNMAGNVINGARGTAIGVTEGIGSSTLVGTLDNNDIGTAAVANSGSLEGSGISIVLAELGSLTANITNNDIRQYNVNGVLMQAGGGATVSSGNLKVVATGNAIGNFGNNAAVAPPAGRNGFHLNSGTLPGDTYSVCLDFGGATAALENSIVGSGDGVATGTDFRFRQRQDTIVRLSGYGGANNDDAAVIAYIQGRNAGTPTGTASNQQNLASDGWSGAACPF